MTLQRPLCWVVLMVFWICGEALSQEIQETTAHEVYEKIITAVGNAHPRAPRLVFKNSKRNPASFNPFTKEISLERNVLKICHDFGADSLRALAYILSHELAHSYCEHGWQTKFAGLDFSNEVDNKVEASQQRVDDETEADLKAGFYSHLAGYDALTVADEFLKRVYINYNLPDSIFGYPSLDERLQIIEQNKTRFQELKHLYETAVGCFVLGQYDYATKLFDQLLDQGFTSREVYNNVGLCLVYRALELGIEDQCSGLIYPFVLDLDTRLEVSDLSRGNTIQSTALDFLRDAIVEFEKALRLSPGYDEAQANLFFADLLLQTVSDDRVKFRFSKEEITQSEAACTYCVRGLCLASEGSRKKALKNFKRGLDSGCAICALNASPTSPKKACREPNQSTFEYNGIDVYCKDFSSNDCDVFIAPNRRIEACYNEQEGFSQTMVKLKQRGSRACITLIAIQKGSLERIPGILIGQLEKSLLNQGLNYEVFNAGSATYYMLKDEGVAFEVMQGVITQGLYFERID